METGSPSWTCMNFQGGTPNKYRKKSHVKQHSKFDP